MAVLTAVATLPSDCTVHIYTDSKALIDKFYLIQSSSSSYFDHARPNFKDTYLSLWYILFSYIRQHHISITLHKVKAHNNNYWNDQTNHLAKQACDMSFPITSLHSDRFSVTPMYNSTAIMTPLRPFLKHITQAQGFYKFVTLRRNSKYRYFNIDWLLVKRHIQGDTPNLSTTFRSSYYKAKRVKLLVEELPTVQFLKHTSPHLYEPTRGCVWCSAEESFKHVWTCSLQLSNQQQLISSSMQHLVQCFSVVCPTINSQHLILIRLFA